MANDPSQANNATVAIAPMTSQGTLGSQEWLTLNPLEISDPTAQTEVAAHDTIGPDNMDEAGALIKVTAAMALRLGATAEVLDPMLEAGVRCSWSGPISRRTAATRPTSATSVHFVVPSGTVLKAGDLIKVTGATNPSNNGVFLVSGVPAATTIPTTPAPVAETFAAAANVCIEVCGYQFDTADLVTTTTAGVTTISATTKDLTELSLVSGQAIQIGSSDAAAYAFATAADNGIAVVTSTPAAGSFTVAPLFGQTFVTDTGTGKTIRLLFGQTLRAVPKTSGNYIDRFHQVETGVENLGTANATAWVYSENCAIDRLTLSMPSNALATLAVDMKATDATKETTQRTNASAPITGKRTLPFSTATADCTGRIYLYSAGTALTGYIVSANLIIENAATDNPAHGSVSSAFTSFGKIRPRLEITAFLTEGGAIDAPRNKTAVTANFVIRNGDGAYVFHIPEAQLSNGAASFPKNQVVTMDLPLKPHKDTRWGSVLIVSKIPGCPALAARAA